ncbi:MAG: phenylalanine--tRNA ligase subunit beta [Nitrospinae bacterium]|nr:phenylalanine--tRNA ligase subunit beta [Nitrospinota bacterium]
MKISLRWLEKFVKFDPDPERLAHCLTMAGLEVEGIEKVKGRDGLEDTVLEVGLTPNRADCLSVLGIAREVSALTGKSLKYPRFQMEERGESIENQATVALEVPDMCPRYAARLITDVKIGPSPDWLAGFLEAIGQRSINNVVDVTNYVMFELGQPLHAFDYHLLHGNRIIVRKARQGENFESIDRTKCRLHEDVLVIADADRAVALAGIMGAGNSEVNEGTSAILLECAYFQPALIRKTSKEYKIHSESSHRFERGTDPNGLQVVVDYAACLIAEVSGGKIAKGRIDLYPSPIPKAEVSLRIDRANKVLGAELKPETIKTHLERLSFSVSGAGDGTFLVSVPTFRTDITREIDLIEEIARLEGYNNIQPSMPKCAIVEPERPGLAFFKQNIKNIFAGFGFQEIITYSFINKEAYAHLQIPEESPLRNWVSIINPISQEQDVLRTVLIPSMLETVARNINAGIGDLMFFEIGKVFQSNGPGNLPDESSRLIAAVTEKTTPNLWSPNNTVRDFYSIKGAFQAFCERIHAYPSEMEPRNYPYFLPGKSFRIAIGKVKIGEMGEVHPRVIESFGIGQRVFLFEVSLDALFEKIQPVPKLQALPRFPSTLRDLSIVVKKTVLAEEIANAMKEIGGEILREVSLFDKFEGGNIPQGERSLTYSMSFRSDARTLTDGEVDHLQQKVLDGLAERFSARLR